VREAHHRIKNNLQAVCDVLELELMDCGRRDGAPAQAIEHSVQRVRAIAMVHEFLSRHHDVAMVDVAKVLERLVPLAVTGNQRRDQQVEAVVKAPSLMQTAKRTTAIALIVNEFISNAVQHGLNHGRRGAVKVEMKDRNGTVSLTVSDNGSGLPEGFDPCVHAHVGLEIARVLAERDLGGSITIERPRNRKSGTVARITFRK
jgi:two-component sensor histidine kinase